MALLYSWHRLCIYQQAAAEVPEACGHWMELLLSLIHIFFLALKNTGIVLGVSAVTVIPLSFLLALLLDRAFPGTKLAKALNFSPNIIAPILVGLIWVFILDPGMGLVNALLRQLGMVSLQPEWIGGRTLTPYSVAFVYLWKVLGYNATIFMAVSYTHLARAVVTVEEHSPFGGLGSMVSQAVAGHCPKKVINLSLPDSPVVSGTSREVFDYYGLNAAGITAAAKEALER